jgi:hypothetical protein
MGGFGSEIQATVGDVVLSLKIRWRTVNVRAAQLHATFTVRPLKMRDLTPHFFELPTQRRWHSVDTR